MLREIVRSRVAVVKVLSLEKACYTLATPAWPQQPA
jgi:hypothetical protein